MYNAALKGILHELSGLASDFESCRITSLTWMRFGAITAFSILLHDKLHDTLTLRSDPTDKVDQLMGFADVCVVQGSDTPYHTIKTALNVIQRVSNVYKQLQIKLDPDTTF